MRNRIVAIASLLVLIALPLAAQEGNLETMPCDNNTPRCSEAYRSQRVDQANGGCILVCYIVLACWEGCSSLTGPPSWYEIQDRGSIATVCPPATPSEGPLCR